MKTFPIQKIEPKNGSIPFFFHNYGQSRSLDKGAYEWFYFEFSGLSDQNCSIHIVFILAILDPFQSLSAKKMAPTTLYCTVHENSKLIAYSYNEFQNQNEILEHFKSYSVAQFVMQNHCGRKHFLLSFKLNHDHDFEHSNEKLRQHDSQGSDFKHIWQLLHLPKSRFFSEHLSLMFHFFCAFVGTTSPNSSLFPAHLCTLTTMLELNTFKQFNNLGFGGIG
jgi:hypothetical protein